MMWSRIPCRWALLLFLYVAADLIDPSIPGVFSLESTGLFVDGVVQLKSSSSRDHATTQPLVLGGAASYDSDRAAATVRSSPRRTWPRRMRWKNVKRDDAASFGSPSSPDSAPTPPLS